MKRYLNKIWFTLMIHLYDFAKNEILKDEKRFWKQQHELDMKKNNNYQELKDRLRKELKQDSYKYLGQI